jgi:hypothetical protein
MMTTTDSWARERWRGQVEDLFDDPWGYIGDGTQQTEDEQQALVRESVAELSTIGAELGINIWVFAKYNESISEFEIERIRSCFITS